MDDERLPPERMRASDADRDAVARHLGHALQEGRLALDEYHERLDRAMASVTLGDLSPLTRDLPAPPPEVLRPPARRPEAQAPETDRSREWHRRLEPWRGLAAVSVVLIGIWGVTSVIAGGLLPFWPLIPIGFMFVFTFAGALSGAHHRPPDRGQGRSDRPWPPPDGR